jgi:hypothetical protein
MNVCSSVGGRCSRGWLGVPPVLKSIAFRSPIRHTSAADTRYCRSGCGCSSEVERNLAKVGVGGSNPFARSSVLASVAVVIPACSMQ